MIDREKQLALAAPFPPDQIKWKPQSVKDGKALAVAFIDARRVMDRLDEVLGVGGWQDEYQVLGDGSVQCQLRVKCGDEWICKSDVGGQSEQPDQGDKMKSAFSESLKRAAVKLGVARYLYRLPMKWCAYDQQKRQFTEKPQLPPWALPAGTQQQPAPQQQPRPAAPVQPQHQQSPPAQPAPGGSPLAGAIKAVADSKSAVELEAAVFAAKALLKQGSIQAEDMVKVGDAVQSKMLHFIRDCQDKPALDQLHTYYLGHLIGAMNQTRQAAIAEAFAAKFEQLSPKPAAQHPAQPAADLF